MPAWWGKKSSKNKDSQSDSPKSPTTSNNTSINRDREFDDKQIQQQQPKKKNTTSFDELVTTRNSPRNSKDYASKAAIISSTSGFSGFDSPSSSLDRLYPLPRPSLVVNNNINNNSNDHVGVIGLGSNSVSVSSSVSSSGSSDDHPHQFITAPRVQGDNKLKSPRARSPGPTSRAATSPLHPRFSGLNLDSPPGKVEDGGRGGGGGGGECHRLPLPPGSPTSPSALPIPPRTVVVTETVPINTSKWKKGRLLGRGTFGHVYLGFNSEKGKMCAIKEVKVVADDQTSKECLKQLNQEINLLSQLCHRNIVQYHGSELSEQTLSVYLEYVSGGSIHKLLQEYGAFTEPVIQNYTRQILSGLAYLHGRNTVHRDIKGANILVDPNGEVKLADFGMAKHITSCTSMLSFKGSPYWMAPEVVMNANGYSLEVDIWSLGCTILEMAASKPPWSQYEGVAAIFKIGNSKDLPEIPDHLSPEAKGFIRLCLQRDPLARPSAAQLLDHPFVREQTIARSSNINITREAFPHAFDGSRTPSAQEMHSSRINVGSSEGYGTNQNVTASRTYVNQRGTTRSMTSLPVSPCSSPLRQHAQQQRSFFLSPPHPSYAWPSQPSQSTQILPVKANTRAILDPWLEIPILKTSHTR